MRNIRSCGIGQVVMFDNIWLAVSGQESNPAKPIHIHRWFLPHVEFHPHAFIKWGSLLSGINRDIPLTVNFNGTFITVPYNSKQQQNAMPL